MGKIAWIGAMALACLMPQAAQSQMNRCTAADGSTTFSQLPCPGGSTAQEMSGSRPRPAPVTGSAQPAAPRPGVATPGVATPGAAAQAPASGAAEADAAEKALRQDPLIQAMTPACQDRFIAHTRSVAAGRGPLIDMRNAADAACMQQLYSGMAAERKVETMPAVPPDLRADCRAEFQRFLAGVDWQRVAASDTKVTQGAAIKAQAFRTTPCGQAYFQLMKGKEATQWADYKNASTQLKQNVVIYWMMDKRHP